MRFVACPCGRSCYISQGQAPILFGQPALECLGLTRGEPDHPGGENALPHPPDRVLLPEDFKDHADIECPTPVDVIFKTTFVRGGVAC